MSLTSEQYYQLKDELSALVSWLRKGSNPSIGLKLRSLVRRGTGNEVVDVLLSNARYAYLRGDNQTALEYAILSLTTFKEGEK